MIVGTEDMVLLPKSNDASITENLKLRLSSSEIYTNIGHVLVAANPYKWLEIYDAGYVKKYVHQQRVDVPPHIFATAEAAYRNMVTEDDNQCVIISGESGAGKTEASKQIQNYIAAVCGGGEEVDKLKTTFLESNPVLEAFGNAKTLRNNNSSRFGKYFTLKFNRFGVPLGGKVTNYLLEKSRIVRPGKGERNFHIFYQLLASSYVEPLGLSRDPENYRYLSVSKCRKVDGVNDASESKITVKAMNHVDIKNKQIQSILSLVASVLHMGNVQFSEKDVNGSEGSKINKECKSSLSAFCDLTKVELESISHALLFRQLHTMAPGGKIDTYEVPQNPSQAAQRRDAISKAIYERLFDLIVERINVALDNAEATAQKNTSASPNYGDDDDDNALFIGVLDIYGFEVFEKNGFEQLCINYVNEKLQQIFIELTLRAEQDEYNEEGITWTPIPFFNNKIVCDLLDAGAPRAGMFRLLDDTCKTLHGMQDPSEIDRKYLDNVTGMHHRHDHFSVATGGKGKSFIIKHYAGDVTYTLGTFSESNNDSLGKDLILALQSSTDKLMNRLFHEAVDLNDKKAPPTAGFKIRNQCQSLVTALMDCSPHYVRCIKSNDEKKALSMDMNRCRHQVQYLGLGENIKVRRAGYAYRAEYYRFLNRFNILCPATYPEWRGSDRDGCKKILAQASKQLASLNREEAQLGTTKLFIRQPETYFALEKLREVKLGDFVAVIQRTWRNYKGLKDYVSRQHVMAELFQSKRKSRRRDSIFRPYQGDYLGALGTLSEEVKTALFRVIDFYDDTENVLFADDSCAQLIGYQAVSSIPALQAAARNSSSSSGERREHFVERKLVVLTDAALYVFDNLTSVSAPLTGTNRGGGKGSQSQARAIAPSFCCLDPAVNNAKPLPAILLRRRIALGVKRGNRGGSNGESTLSELALSLSADTAVGIKVIPRAAATTTTAYSGSASSVSNYDLTPKTDHFCADDSVKNCQQSGETFTLFNRRHHCRVSGKVCVDAVCNFTQNIPDWGYYTPQRVNDGDIGLMSTDLPEDLLLLLPRKTELVSLIAEAWGKMAGGNQVLPLSFDNTMRFTGGKSVAPKGMFASTVGMACSMAPASVSFGKELRNKEYPTVPLVDVSIIDCGPSTGIYSIASPAGLSATMVEEKQARARERQKEKAKKRKKADKERKARAAEREEKREMLRQEKLAAKRAKKKKEKAAKKAAAAGINTDKSTGKVGGGARSFGKPPTPPSTDAATNAGPQSELQRMLARRAGK